MLRVANQTPRYSLLQGLYRIRPRISFRLADQQVNMLRHDHVPVNPKSEAAPHPLQSRFEDLSARLGGQKPTAIVTAECDEMTLTTLVKTCQSPRHGDKSTSSNRVMSVTHEHSHSGQKRA